MLYNSNVRKEHAVVAQSVERFLGKEEVRQFKSAQQLQRKEDRNSVLFFFIIIDKILCNSQQIVV